MRRRVHFNRRGLRKRAVDRVIAAQWKRALPTTWSRVFAKTRPFAIGQCKAVSVSPDPAIGLICCFLFIMTAVAEFRSAALLAATNARTSMKCLGLKNAWQPFNRQGFLLNFYVCHPIVLLFLCDFLSAAAQWISAAIVDASRRASLVCVPRFRPKRTTAARLRRATSVQAQIRYPVSRSRSFSFDCCCDKIWRQFACHFTKMAAPAQFVLLERAIQNILLSMPC